MNLTLAVLVAPPPLADAVAAAAPPPLAGDPPPGDDPPSSSGRNISITPTIPPPWGRIMRICGRPSSLVLKVTCPGPLREVKLARICSTRAALMGKPDMDC